MDGDSKGNSIWVHSHNAGSSSPRSVVEDQIIHSMWAGANLLSITSVLDGLLELQARSPHYFVLDRPPK
nr:hypothetical protein Iba_chr05cCG16110 [Ipomoea batatas]